MIAAYGEAIRTLVRLTPWLIAWAWRTGVRGHPWRTAAIVAFLLLFIVPIEPFSSPLTKSALDTSGLV